MKTHVSKIFTYTSMLSENHRHGGGMGDGNKINTKAVDGLLNFVLSQVITESGDLNYFVNRFNPSTNSGDESYTVGFEPKCVIIFGIGNNSYIGNVQDYFSFGFADSDNQFCFNKAKIPSGLSPNQTIENYIIYHSVGGSYSRATLKSLDSNSFTLTWEIYSQGDATSVSNGRYIFLAIG